MWQVLLDALIDTAKVAPFLFLVYVFIEVIEEYTFRNAHHKILKSKYAVALGAGIGIVPQCGFSIVSTELYGKRKITLGTLLAIFIATSDEALPVLISNTAGWTKILHIILIKFVWAIIVGYMCDLILHLGKKRMLHTTTLATPSAPVEATIVDGQAENTKDDHDEHDHDEHDSHIRGCCGHDVEDEKPSTLSKFLWHPLIHTLKILLFILVVNIIFGTIVHFITEERLMAFLSGISLIQPLCTAVVGLIPNCAASVIITDLYIMNGLTLGACISGLCVNAGLGILYLFKNNRHIKENIFIVLFLFVSSILLGMGIDFVISLF